MSNKVTEEACLSVTKASFINFLYVKQCAIKTHGECLKIALQLKCLECTHQTTKEFFVGKEK